MAVSKVVLGDETLIDLTSDTVSEDTLLEGTTAHGANGEEVIGGVVVTPMYTGTKSAIEEAIALGQITEDAVVNITDDEETSSFQTQIDEINSSLVKLKNQSVTFTNGHATFSHESIKTTSIIFVQAVSLNGRGNMAMTIDIDEIVNNGSFVLKAYDAYNNKNYSGTILVNILICN